MKCGAMCKNVKLQMGNYLLKSNMFSIGMGGNDVVFGAEWLQTLHIITMDFRELYMSINEDVHRYTLKGLNVGFPKIINSHYMEKLPDKGHSGIVA